MSFTLFPPCNSHSRLGILLPATGYVLDREVDQRKESPQTAYCKGKGEPGGPRSADSLIIPRVKLEGLSAIKEF